ncbi:MBL fold metallo-hydrolase [Streptomyces geranii]|uniref:MBL fold metallo-hydrolase n=1 Tax=Streptomyces geranii TaxID=2058923 RepID=UPI000D0291F5|nr:MBL fold metallo-hydrolase [Streptomyces geranii]
MTVTWEEPRWDDLGWERLAAGVGRRRLPVWDCTVGLVVGAGGALLVDAGSSLREGSALRLEARKLAGRRVDLLALTHAHFDHVFGAAVFAGAHVVAAEGVGDEFGQVGREALCADAVRNGLDAGAAEEAADTLVVPHELLSTSRTLSLALPLAPLTPAPGTADGPGEVHLVNAGPGHTRGDLVAVVPGEPTVVFCGDLVEESGEPQAGPDAVPSHWPAALDRLLALGGEDALYVPGHGAVVDAAFVRAQRDALASRFGVSR